MKQTLVPKLTLTKHKKFNQQQSRALKILEYSNDELLTYLTSKGTQNPYLSFQSDQDPSDSDAFLAYDHSQRSLYDEIMEQLQTSTYKLDKELCDYLIYNLDSNGYFEVPFSTLVKGSKYTKDSVKHHLAILRTFEPHGCFAFNLKECLQIQCRLSKKPIAKIGFILCDYLEAIALAHIDTIKNKTNLSDMEITQAIEFIQTLHPKPAANYGQNAIYTNPEFKIEVTGQNIAIQLLHDDLKIHFDNDEQCDALSEYLKKQREEVEEIISNIQKRNITLLQIMQSICDIQQGFFLKNESLKHCTLEMIAQKCNLHISTVSRAMTNKSCEFNHQYFTLKSFMSSGGTKDHSQKEIKDRIVEIIDQENKQKPISDEKISKLLLQEGISISRRAVSKYRESRFIFNSTKRKQR